MKVLLFILIPLFATAQMPEIKIGKCAGKDAILLWGGGGPDFGEFTLVVGEGPTDGPYFEIMHGQSIASVKCWYAINNAPETWLFESMLDRPNNMSTFGKFKGIDRGDIIYFRYAVTRKKNPRA